MLQSRLILSLLFCSSPPSPLIFSVPWWLSGRIRGNGLQQRIQLGESGKGGFVACIEDGDMKVGRGGGGGFLEVEVRFPDVETGL